jgi:hypothetical protein
VRRIVSFVLLGLGVFAVALGLLLRFYAYPQLAKVPLDNESTSVAEGDGVTALVIETVDGAPVPEVRNNLSVTATTYVTGDLRAPEVVADGDVAVYVEAIKMVDDTSGITITASVRSLCIDRFTSEAVTPCEDQYIEQEQGKAVRAQRDDLQQPGISFKFPFGTEQKDYSYYDLSSRQAITATYEGEDSIQGLDTYRFEMSVPPTKIAEREVPGALVGRPDTPSLTADMYYQVKRTVWVEPETGIIVVGQQELKQELVPPGESQGDGTVVFDGQLRFNDKTINDNVNKAEDNMSKLRLMTTWPIVLWIGGGLMIVVAVVLLVTDAGRGGQRATGTTPPRRRQPANAR